jgi:hypothetical protein
MCRVYISYFHLLLSSPLASVSSGVACPQREVSNCRWTRKSTGQQHNSLQQIDMLLIPPNVFFAI